MSEPPPTIIELQGRDAASLSEQLAAIESGDTNIELIGADGQDCFGAFLELPNKLVVRGNLGDYAFVANQSAIIEIHGDVASACGQAIEGGSIVVRGNAGASVGSFGRGGWIAVYGTAGPRCGVCLKNGELIVRGNVGPQAGWMMQGGTMVIGGSAGPELGLELKGGTIFVRGEVESLATGMEEFRLKDADHFKLGLLLLKAGIKAAGKDFRGYRKGTDD